MAPFGIEPRVAFLSHSMYGSAAPLGAQDAAARDLFVAAPARRSNADGEMQGRRRAERGNPRAFLPSSTLAGSANVLICPNLDAANILFNVLKITGGHGITMGPILLGAAGASAHPHAVGHGAPGREHDGADGGRSGASLRA